MVTTEQTSGTPAQTTDTPAPPAQQTPTSAVTDGSPKREYTQAELDQLFAERSVRAAQQATKKLLDALGVTSVDELPKLKDTITKAREIEQSNLSALERAEKAAEAEKKRADDAVNQLNTERANHRTSTIKSAILQAATAMKSPDAELVLLHAQSKHGETVNGLVGEDGTLDQKKLTTLLDTVKKEKPLLFTPPGGSGIPSNHTGHAPSTGDKPRIDLGALPKL
jgi:hypothetical protein